MEIKASDLSAQPIPEEQLAQAQVDHPDYAERRLDITAEEADRIGELAIKEPVVVLVRKLADGEPQEPHRYIMTKANFGKLVTRATVDVVMHDAKIVAEDPVTRGRGNGDRVDYSTLENAGRPHKGKVSPEEAEAVRLNLEAVNERLAAAGERTIDPADPAMMKRYGFEPVASVPTESVTPEIQTS